jgi:amidase
MTDADFAFDVVRAEAFLAAFADTAAPGHAGPQRARQRRHGRRISLADRARAHLVQTRIARHFAQALERVDLIVAPVTPVTPFPWTTLYAEQVDGQAMANYYQWLALTYGVTLSTHPALSLPCGATSTACPSACRSWAGCAATPSCWPPRTRWSRRWPATRRPRGRCPTWPRCGSRNRC